MAFRKEYVFHVTYNARFSYDFRHISHFYQGIMFSPLCVGWFVLWLVGWFVGFIFFPVSSKAQSNLTINYL